MDESEIRRMRTQLQTVWDEKLDHAKPKGRWRWHDEIAAMAHTRTRHPFPGPHRSCMVVHRRISGGVM